MTGTSWLLRFEGMNFDSTVYDTNDISTVRGAGLALLAAEADAAAAVAASGSARRVETVFCGASLGAFLLDADAEGAMRAVAAVRAALERPGRDGAPHNHLSFAVDLAAVGPETDTREEERALAVAQARNRGRQFRAFTVDMPDPEAAAVSADPLDGKRQATVPGEHADPGIGRRRMAPSVRDRHRYGRGMRARFYVRGGGALAVTDSFEEIVASPPTGLPKAVQGKLAYLYADGNAFSEIRGLVGTRRFAGELAGLQAGLLGRIRAWLQDGLNRSDPFRAVHNEAREQRIRFETLLWGGDDMLLVMPAWLGLHVLGEMAKAVRSWTVAGHPLTFAFGMVICNAKTPVRQARTVANALSEAAKSAVPYATSANIQVFESLSPLDIGLGTLRTGLFGLPRTQAAAGSLDRMLTVTDPSDLGPAIRTLTAGGLREGALAPAVLHAALAAARGVPQGLISQQATDAARAVLAEAFTRFGKAVPNIAIPGPVERGLIADLWLVAMLRDYCTLPEGVTLAAFPDEAPA